MIITLPLNNGFSLSNLQPSDEIAYVEHLNNPLIHETTATIPYPYTQAHAKQWIQRQTDLTYQFGKPHLLAVRNSNAELIGSIGIGEIAPQSHVAELGYWLAPKDWRQGIMTEAVGSFVRYAFADLNLLRLWTRVFEFNPGSRRVLEKNGFQLEGIQRQHIYRSGKFADDYLYGLLKSDLGG